jgi:hypothetical protein
LLLTRFPQEEFNQTEDRKSADQSLGVTCLHCHQHFHSNAAFHLAPDVRPQADRFRLDTTSLHGLFNQHLHDGRLLTLADTVEFFNLVLGLRLVPAEKEDLVAYPVTL